MKKIFIAMIFAGLLAGCASSKKTVTEEAKGKPGSAYDESFDPLSLNDDDIEIKSDKESPQVKKKPVEAAAAVEETPTTSNLPFKETDGYRVQLLTTKSYEAATVAQQTAAEQFAPLNLKTYIKFEAPLYKVRVGDALTRSEAEEIRETARDFGYKGAFIVRSKVMVQERTQ